MEMSFHSPHPAHWNPAATGAILDGDGGSAFPFLTFVILEAERSLVKPKDPLCSLKKKRGPRPSPTLHCGDSPLAIAVNIAPVLPDVSAIMLHIAPVTAQIFAIAVQVATVMVDVSLIFADVAPVIPHVGANALGAGSVAVAHVLTVFTAILP
jgi:hypothetical protein